MLRQALRAGLPLLCANPDLLVHRGGVEEICAGAIAERYDSLGGRTVYHGKPHVKIYDTAPRRWASAAAVGQSGSAIPTAPTCAAPRMPAPRAC